MFWITNLLPIILLVILECNCVTKEDDTVKKSIYYNKTNDKSNADVIKEDITTKRTSIFGKIGSSLGLGNINTDTLSPGNFIPGIKFQLPADTILDQVFVNVQKFLMNYTRVEFPTYTYSGALATATLNSYFEGFHTLRREGPVIFNAQAFGKKQLEFGLGWTDIAAIFDTEVISFQFGFTLVSDKGTTTFRFSNLTSIQGFSIDPLKMTFELDNLVWSLGEAAITYDGNNPLHAIVVKMLNGFINVNKELVLGILSVSMKAIFNACIQGMQAFVFS